ncbi:MAG TPA: hypothetical protein EYN06_09105 [Myxococcales bacterium]|nr:hypothetical protein [Myxococcales bacterium]HIN86625.1 hypothetical protein [Myxococcales bacterium]
MLNTFTKYSALIILSSSLAIGCVHEMGPIDSDSPEQLLQNNEMTESKTPKLRQANGEPAESPAIQTALSAPSVPTMKAVSFVSDGGQSTGSINLILTNPTLHTTKPTATVAVRILDADGLNVGSDVIAKTVFSAPFLPEGSQSFACMTDKYGTCTFTWTAPDAAFEEGGNVAIDVTAGNLNAQAMLSVFAAPNPLVIQKPGAGVQLPTSPYAEGSTFQVPLYIATNGTVPGAYDIEFNFDPTKLRIIGASSGSCDGFAAPTTNAAFNANEEGTLHVIGIGSTAGYDCVNEESVHVANLTFEVLPGAANGDATATSPVSCVVHDLIDENLTELAEEKPCDFGDAMGTSKSGEVLIQPAH